MRSTARKPVITSLLTNERSYIVATFTEFWNEKLNAIENKVSTKE